MAISNTTPTPNKLFNGEMRKMSDTEFRVVSVVTRATLGWEVDHLTRRRKTEDWISSTQFIEKTGRGKTAISAAIESATKKGWIEARDSKGNILDTPGKRRRKKIFYRLGRIFLDKISGSESELDEKSSSESINSAGSNSGQYKRKTNTKDTRESKDSRATTKEKTDGLQQEEDSVTKHRRKPKGDGAIGMWKLIGWAEDVHGRIFTNLPKQYNAMNKARLAGFSLQDVKNQWNEMEYDDWWTEKGFDFADVVSQLSKRSRRKSY